LERPEQHHPVPQEDRRSQPEHRRVGPQRQGALRQRQPYPTGFSLRSGLVLAMEGKTVSGVGVRGELWLGAKQGLECFGECKPLERFFNQMVTGGGFNNVEEEKLFLTNVVIAGIRNDLRAEFHFDLRQCTIDQVDNDGDGWFGEDP
jgi:hypothetical protein